MKQITITVPDNYELKQDGNTYIIVKKEKKLTYEDIAKKLFDIKTVYWINNFGEIDFADNVKDYYLQQSNSASSKRQLEKLLAINKLMNVANYLNDGWKPDWSNGKESKYCIYVSGPFKNLSIDSVRITQNINVYFKSEELALQAIEILGEETIKLALCTDY